MLSNSIKTCCNLPRYYLFLSLLFFFISSCSSFSSKDIHDDYSGFLSDYSQLQEVKGNSDRLLLIWIDPNFKNKAYKKLLIKPVQFYPNPETNDKTKKAFLNDLLQSMNKQLFTVAKNDALPVTQTEDSSSIRLESVLTAVSVAKTGLKPREVIPVMLLIAAIESATDRRSHDVTVNLEYRLVDSATNKVMVRGLVRGDTESLKHLTLKDASQLLHKWDMDFNTGFLRFKEKFIIPLADG